MTENSPADRIRELALSAFDQETPEHRSEAIFRAISDTLTEAGHLILPEWAPLLIKVGRKTVGVHGYEYNDEQDILTVIHILDCHSDRDLHQYWTRELCPSGDISKAFADLEEIVSLARDGKLPLLEESDRANELCSLLKKISKRDDSRISLCVWTTGELSKEGWKRSDKSRFFTEVWDAGRLENAMNTGNEALVVDFRAYGGIVCLFDDKDYDRIGSSSGVVMIGKIPGECLAKLYFEHRTRLLQHNVRAFLSFSGGINRGIRDTVNTEPRRFLAYNNGVAATASSVDMERLASGVYRLLGATDFQIVNGGQTTATLMSTLGENSDCLADIEVAMKLTIVRPEDLDGLVPKISLYANTQNKIQDSDLASNNPWLIKLETISRRVEASKDDKSQGQPIKWYFERVRGQYNVDLGKCSSVAQKNAFKAKNPLRAKFSKTDFSLAAIAWEGEPDVASLGPQKCFGSFVKRLAAVKEVKAAATTLEPSEEDFRRLCCVLLLRRVALAICREIQISPRLSTSCVSSYAIGLLSYTTKGKLPWSEIWTTQAVPEYLMKALRIAIRGCEGVILRTADERNRLASEHAKKADCWEAVIKSSVVVDVGPVGRGWDKFSIMDTVRPAEMVEAGEVFFSITQSEWKKLAAKLAEAKPNNPAYSGCANTMAAGTVIHKKPTEKQARILAKGLILLRSLSSSREILSKVSDASWTLLEGIAK